ncbi:MAG: thioesterase-like protein [Rhodospirillales bacterium]|nr:thioesterase-like protein [Rhodospirillales bacterium]
MPLTAPESSPPLVPHEETVRPEWIDYNGHMNVAYYVLAFDHATDKLLDVLGIGEAYRRDENGSFFVVESHVVYRRELRVGDSMRIETEILDHDNKRLHGFSRMFRAADGEVAASYEFLGLHMDMTARRAAPFPAPALARIRALAARQGVQPRPAEAGRSVRIPTR